LNNPYLQILAAAADSRKTHYEREAEHTRAHFARHPECRKIIMAMDADGYVTRAKGEIDIEARCQAGWFKPSMWKGTYYEAARPIEAEVEAVEETIWVQVKTGSAVNVHTFMHTYLKDLCPAPVPARQPARKQRTQPEQRFKALAPMI
jgi:hypothetical protein